MKHIYTILDRAIDAFGPTFECRANGEAIRMFKDECNNPDSRISKHPNDFELFKVADWDDQTGVMIGQSPERIAKATDYKEVQS